MKKKLFRSLLPALALAAGAAATLPAHAALVKRGNDMVYDTVSNLTWITNAGLGGQQTWADAKAWAENLVFEGRDDWRLPGLTPVNGTALNLTFNEHGITDAGFNNSGLNSELGFLFYQSLPGNNDTDGLVNTGPFEGLEAFAYWTGADSPNADEAMAFFTFNGEQKSQFADDLLFAWAVRAGDTPEPASLALVAAALGGLAFTRRAKKGQAK